MSAGEFGYFQSIVRIIDYYLFSPLKLLFVYVKLNLWQKASWKIKLFSLVENIDLGKTILMKFSLCELNRVIGYINIY